jgi:hypothetical protein
MQVAGDLIMRAADFPMAGELADRLEKTLPPGLQDKKGQPELPPEVQQHLQQADQMAQVAAQHIDELTQQLEQSKQSEAAKIAGEQAKTEREMAAIQAKAELQMQQAEIDAQIAIRKAAIEAETKKQVAQMQIAADHETEELRGYIELQKVKMAGPSAAMTADVESDFGEEEELPAILRRRLGEEVENPLQGYGAPRPPKVPTRKVISIMAPSGQTYSGTIQDEPIGPV